MTDREFEKLMKAEEEQKQERQRKKRTDRRNKKKRLQPENKGYCQDKGKGKQGEAGAGSGNEVSTIFQHILLMCMQECTSWELIHVELMVFLSAIYSQDPY